MTGKDSSFQNCLWKNSTVLRYWIIANKNIEFKQVGKVNKRMSTKDTGTYLCKQRESWEILTLQSSYRFTLWQNSLSILYTTIYIDNFCYIAKLYIILSQVPVPKKRKVWFSLNSQSFTKMNIANKFSSWLPVLSQIFKKSLHLSL